MTSYEECEVERILQCYRINKIDDGNTITFKMEDLIKVFEVKFSDEKSKQKQMGLNNCTICKEHGLMIKSDDNNSCCTDMSKLKECFCVKLANLKLIYPPPIFFTIKNYSYFRSHIEYVYKLYQQLINDEIIEKKYNFLVYKDDKPKMMKAFFVYIKKVIYKRFMMNDFNMGNFKILQSGKRSYMRFHLLGHRINGTRMTMTVDNNLTPHHVSIPKGVYDQLQLATNLVVVKRDPSINDTSVYVCELLFHESDSCIHVNPFILDGLHADQDGDEIPIYYIKRESEIPSPLMKMTIFELNALSWNNGKRYNLLLKPRYSLGQQYRHLLYTHDNWFIERSSFYKHLSAIFTDRNEKFDALMSLSGTVFREEVDSFFRLMIYFNQTYKDPNMCLSDYIHCNDEIIDVYKSKSKGSTRHVDIYKEGLSKKKTFDDYIFSFNNKINSGKTLEKEGQTQFSLLHALSPATIMCKNLMFSDHLLIENYTDCDLMAMYNHDKHFVKYVVVVFKKHYGSIQNAINSNSDHVKRLLWMLINTRNSFFMSIDRLPFGIHMCILTQSQKIQSALNVKRLKDLKDDVVFEKGTMQPVVPEICIKWLYNPKEYNWFRVHLKNGANAKNVYEKLKKFDVVGYSVLLNNIVEYYFDNTNAVVKIKNQICAINDCDDIANIIFMSNCAMLKRLNIAQCATNQSFVDNVTSFLYCYFKNALCVDHSNIEFVFLYNFISIMFLLNKNLNNPTESDTISPLHATSGEYPMRVLTNFIKNQSSDLYYIETARDYRCVGKPANYFGGTNACCVFLIYESSIYNNLKKDNNNSKIASTLMEGSTVVDDLDISIDHVEKDCIIVQEYLINDDVKEFLVHLVNCDIYQKHKAEYKVLQIKLNIDKICSVSYKFIRFNKKTKVFELEKIVKTPKAKHLVHKTSCFNEQDKPTGFMSKVYITFKDENGDIFLETHTGQYFGNHFSLGGHLELKKLSDIGKGAVNINCNHNFVKYEQNDRAGDEAVTIKTICTKCSININDATVKKIVNYKDVKDLSQSIKMTLGTTEDVKLDALSRLMLEYE